MRTTITNSNHAITATKIAVLTKMKLLHQRCSKQLEEFGMQICKECMWKLCLLWYDLHASDLVKVGNDDISSFEQKIKTLFIKKYFTGKKI
jgi:hypothetical protein